MKALVLAWILGTASWWAWPEAWRLGLLLGWSMALLLEAWLLAKRKRLLLMAPPPPDHPRRGGQDLLQVLVSGFLLKLFLLAGGGFLGAKTGLFHYPSFLLAFLVGVFYGEGIGFVLLLRLPPSPKSEHGK